MKIIETEYKGTIYRSRTEARWAVFMTALNFPFVYEPECFDLGKDGWYVPDFWLPSIDSFMEVKPEIMVEGRESPTLALCRETKKDVYVFFGQPKMPDFGESHCIDNAIKHFGEGGEDYSYWFCCCPHCKQVGIEFNGRSDRIACKCPRSSHGDKGYNFQDSRLEGAYHLARNSFRFRKNDP